MILAVTGHRPQKLGGFSLALRDALICHARTQLVIMSPDKVITGMALGWDQAVAQACCDLSIPFIAAVPFQGFDRDWPDFCRMRLEKLLRFANEVEVVSPFPGSVALNRRNEWMVDRAEHILALWDGSWGGTFNCIRYAEKKKVPYTNTYEDWVKLSQDRPTTSQETRYQGTVLDL
jgi:uncharacterized phage-like protein YoqJ